MPQSKICLFWFTRPMFYYKLQGQMQILNLIVDFLLYTPLPKTLTYFTVLVLAVFLGTFISKRKHLLRTLLSLEGLILILFSLVALVSCYYIAIPVFILVYLALVACEGALGLSLLVNIVRTHGRDHFSSINSLQC